MVFIYPGAGETGTVERNVNKPTKTMRSDATSDSSNRLFLLQNLEMHQGVDV